jgi:hypothetical protein
VVGDEMRMWNCIAVEKHEIISLRARNGLVENARATKTFLWLPEMSGGDGLTGGPALKKSSRAIGGAVISQENFVRY